MLITLTEESLKELIDRSWLCDVYARKISEVKKALNDKTSDLETFTRINEIVK